MKSNKEILVSYCPPVTDKDGKLIFKKDGTLLKPSTGHPFEHRKLYDLLIGQQSLSKTAVKGSEGEIYAYLGDKLDIRAAEEAGKDISDGIIFIDIDKMGKDDVTTIYNAFDKIVASLPNVLTCWYSNSYYNTDKEYGGLHFILRVSYATISSNEYKYYVTLYGAILARVIYNICNIDIRPNGKGLDRVTKRISQRFYLNFSEIKWNNDAYPIDPQLDELQKEELHVWVNTYEKWFVRESDYEVVSFEITKFNWDKVLSDDFKVNTSGLKDNQLGHERRITIENFLAGLGWEFDDIVKFMMKICYGGDFDGGKTTLLNAIKQTTRTAISKFRDNPSAKYSAAAKDILTALGVDIEADVERIYQPIDYQYDSIFEEAWESMKDYHPERKPAVDVFRINLKTDEYLTDYKYEITEKIYQHHMTYLVADCMVGKTTFGLNMKSDYGLFNGDDFVAHFHGDTIDMCVPYNSVARNKAKGKSVKRVKTAKLSDFSLDKRNVFIWNTIVPLYEQYFKLGMVKRLVLFFDESQKIVTDDYRWKTVFEMFKVLPDMYTHFVFMTGTPAGELEFLKQYFPDYSVIKVDKEIDYNRECKILKYKQFGLGDMIKVIEDAIADGRLPMIYANAKNSQWKLAIKKINARRIEEGLRPLRVCTYDRPNAENLTEVDEKKSIKNYDVVIATKYCSVGIDFIKDDKRMRTAIIDYANEIDCTFHDIWQFTLRNRDQDTITKIITIDNDMYINKLYNYWYYVRLCNEMARMHTHISKRPELLTEMDVRNFDFIQEVFQLRKFGQLVDGKHKDNYFTDERNVKLLATYYLYVKIFSNINVIKHMLQRRGVSILEIDMEHIVEKMDYTDKKTIYKGFIDNFNDISAINTAKGQYDERSYQIDINDRTKPALYIEDSKIYSVNKHYTDWLIGQFAGKDEWLPVLQEHEYITKETFASYRRMIMIAVRISDKEIDWIKRHAPVMNEDDIEREAVKLVEKHYVEILRNETDKWKKAIIKDVIEDYKKIVRFMVDNIEFIEEIKNATSDGQKLTACHKMQIVIKQKQAEHARKKMSDAAKKAHSKKVTVRYKPTGETVTYDSFDELAKAINKSKQNLNLSLKNPKSHIHDELEIIAF